MRTAVLVSLSAVALLSALAFWPARAWRAPPRPGLHSPIVFDEFVPEAPPPAQPAVTQESTVR